MNPNPNRFPSSLARTVTVLGLAALIFSLARMDLSQIGIPFLLLALVATQVASRYTIPIPRGRGQISPLDCFILLALMLFGGETAILFAVITAMGVALKERKSAADFLFHSAASVLSTFLIVWAVRFSYGPVLEPGSNPFSLNYLNALCIAALIQTLFNSTLIFLGGAYRIKQAIWRTWGNICLWTLAAYGAGALVVAVSSQVITALGPNASIAVATSGALALFFFRAYATPGEESSAQPERYGVALKESSERFRSAFDYAAIGMALVSAEGRWLLVNRSLCRILGYSERELMATDFLTITHPDDLGTALSSIKDLLKGKIPTYQMEKRYIHKQGHEVWVTWSVSLAGHANTKAVHLIFQIQDITDRKRAEERLLHDAFHDALTGLPNRALFMDHLNLAIARSKRRNEQTFAVLYLDLDRFKIINDSLGHMIGDQLLVGIARRLEQCLRPGDTIARLGGDEFTVLIEDIHNDIEAIVIAERIQQDLSLPFMLGGREVFTTVSIGIAPSSAEYERAEEILRDADTAMYRAKSMGKARYEIFDKEMHARALNILQIETDLRRAIERQEFYIQYQPIVGLEDLRLRGFEALIRWRHPERGLISPIDFIPVAEETGLIVAIGEWVLREASRQMREWQVKYPSDPQLFMSVNLSGKQFAQPNLIGEVARIIEEVGIDPRSLKLEITESVVMDNIETATEMLKQLRLLGVQLSIDDFGTGYSSLSYLHRFPIDTLKIDRSFVTQMTNNNENAEIVRTIVMLAQNLGMDVVAEGVETSEQLALLRKLNCENGQGYFFSRPADSKGAEKIIADTYRHPAQPMPLNNAQSFRKVLVA